MFHADRWARAFITVSGADCEEAFFCIRAFAQPVKTIPGALFGHSAAAKLERIMRESCGAAGTAQPLEYAIRFIVLLVERNCFSYIDLVLKKIEQWLDEQKGVLSVTAEAAAPLDSAFEDELKRRIMEKTKAAGIKMKVNVVPGLLGGYRLRMGGFYIDASLKGALEKMTAELTRASIT